MNNPPAPTSEATSVAMSVADVTRISADVLEAVGTVVVGMVEPLRTSLAAILAGGHILFEDVPGLGKTLAARSLAGALGLDFSRLQCTPDLLPADIVGSSLYDPRSHEFVFHPGPVFTGLLLADEINRTPPKTQSALLEAMAEKQVSVEGNSMPLPRPFHVMATANPVEYEGTYPLPEAQLDRFMVRLSVGYPTDEAEVVLRRLERNAEFAAVPAVTDAPTLLAMQQAVEQVQVARDVVDYCVNLVIASRSMPEVEVGASPRGSQTLVLLARARAIILGRDFVLPEDIKAIAEPALAHRLTLTPQAWAAGTDRRTLIARLLEEVPTPATIGSASSSTSASNRGSGN